MTITVISARETELEKRITHLRSELNAERLFSKQAMASVLEIAAQRDAARAELAALQKKHPKSFGETHPANPNATCGCEHWQSCAECHPTEHAKEKTE